MKLKKILTLMCCAVLLVCISVGATVAYLTSTATVKNTFTVGKVAIKLDETEFDEDGNKTNRRTETGNKYLEKLVPAQSYEKDPMVTVLKDSEDCYVRVYMTINNASALDQIMPLTETTAASVFKGLDLTTWKLKSNVKDAEEDTRTYEFWYKEMVPATTDNVPLPKLFTKVVIPSEITSEQLELVTSDVEITLVAQAIQANGFTDAADAWDAWSSK